MPWAGQEGGLLAERSPCCTVPLVPQGCTSLVNLTLSRTPLTSCRGVEHCTALRRLDLRHTGVSDLTPLAACSNLRHLDLGGGYVVGPRCIRSRGIILAFLVCVVRGAGTPVEDLEPLGSCSRLTAVYLDGTQVGR